jgi:hypothetical protein
MQGHRSLLRAGAGGKEKCKGQLLPKAGPASLLGVVTWQPTKSSPRNLSEESI